MIGNGLVTGQARNLREDNMYAHSWLDSMVYAIYKHELLYLGLHSN